MRSAAVRLALASMESSKASFVNASFPFSAVWLTRLQMSSKTFACVMRN